MSVEERSVVVINMKIISFLSILFFFPSNAWAQEGLVSCVGGDACGFCELVTMVNTLVELLVIVITTFTVLLIAFAGFRLITSGGDASALQDAKKYLINAIIGIMIMLAGWTIVDTFLKLIAGGDLGVWNATSCERAYEAGKASGVNVNNTPNVAPSATTGSTGGGVIVAP